VRGPEGILSGSPNHTTLVPPPTLLARADEVIE
jgi:hypothetical protein